MPLSVCSNITAKLKQLFVYFVFNMKYLLSTVIPEEYVSDDNEDEFQMHTNGKYLTTVRKYLSMFFIL